MQRSMTRIRTSHVGRLPPHGFRDGWCDLRGDDRGVRYLGTGKPRPAMSSQPLGGGSRPTCEVLIRVMLRCIFLSFPVPTCDLRMIYDDSDRTGSLAIADTLTVDDLGRDLCDEFEASGG